MGKAYAYYLARKKFNLIFFERNIGPMNELEADMKVAGLTPNITKIVLEKFDQDTLNRHLVNELKSNQAVLSPVKIFINFCLLEQRLNCLPCQRTQGSNRTRGSRRA